MASMIVLPSLPSLTAAVNPIQHATLEEKTETPVSACYTIRLPELRSLPSLHPSAASYPPPWSEVEAISNEAKVKEVLRMNVVEATTSGGGVAEANAVGAGTIHWRAHEMVKWVDKVAKLLNGNELPAPISVLYHSLKAQCARDDRRVRKEFDSKDSFEYEHIINEMTKASRKAISAVVTKRVMLLHKIFPMRVMKEDEDRIVPVRSLVATMTGTWQPVQVDHVSITHIRYPKACIDMAKKSYEWKLKDKECAAAYKFVRASHVLSVPREDVPLVVEHLDCIMRNLFGSRLCRFKVEIGDSRSVTLTPTIELSALEGVMREALHNMQTSSERVEAILRAIDCGTARVPYAVPDPHPNSKHKKRGGTEVTSVGDPVSKRVRYID